MAVHCNVSDNRMTASVGIDHAEAVQERTRILVGLKPGRKLCVIQTAFMLPLFDSYTVNFPVALIVVSRNVLSCKIKSASNTGFVEILHFLQGTGILNKLTQFAISVSSLRQVRKYIPASFVFVRNLCEFWIMIPGRDMIVIFTAPANYNHSMAVLQNFIIGSNLLVRLHLISHPVSYTSQVIKRPDHICCLRSCDTHDVLENKHLGTEVINEAKIEAVQIISGVFLHIFTHFGSAGY